MVAKSLGPFEHDGHISFAEPPLLNGQLVDVLLDMDFLDRGDELFLYSTTAAVYRKIWHMSNLANMSAGLVEPTVM